jgi:hypothetical protein
MHTNDEHDTNSLVPASSATANIGGMLQVIVVLIWVSVPFAVALVAPKADQNAYFVAAIGTLGLLCFALYAIAFNVTEALFIGLIFITNSAFVDHAYLPTVSLLGGTLFLSDYYLIIASLCVLVIGKRREGRLLGSYHKYFVVLALAMVLSAIIGVSRGAEIHYVLRELHPFIYYPLALFMTVRALDQPRAMSRIIIVSVGIVVVSCVATFWQLFLSPQFQFMTSASPVFGLGQGEVLDAQSIRPPSDWLFLVFFLVAVATYSSWKKSRLLVGGIVVLDAFCVLLGYSRTMFLAILGALMVLGLVRKRRILPFIWSVTKTTAVVAVLLTGIYSMLNALAPAYTEAFELRILGSLETSVMDSDEPFVLGSRIYETQMAIEHIVENPFFGLGTGAAYREILPFEFSQVEVAENPEDGRHFMHNIYLFVWMKYGLWGALALGWIAWHFVRQTWVLARQPGDETILPQGILVAFSGIAIANLAAPSFVVSPATPTLVAIMAGFIEVCNLSRQRGLKRSEGRAVDSMSSPSLADPVG